MIVVQIRIPIRMALTLTKTVDAPQATKMWADEWYKKVGQQVTYPKQFTVSVVIVDDKEMKRLNKQYRNADYVTDVLSFNYNEDDADDQQREIVICYSQAKRQAKHKQHTIITELSWLLVHGLLHVLGYDHEEASDAKIMRPLERAILAI